jgi:hypothetical protein
MALKVRRTGHNMVAWEGSTSQPRTTKNRLPSGRKGRAGKLPPVKRSGGRSRRFGPLG